MNSRKIVDATTIRLEGQRNKETTQNQGRSIWSEPNPWWGIQSLLDIPPKEGDWTVKHSMSFHFSPVPVGASHLQKTAEAS